MADKKVCLLIQARMASQRVPNKMVRPFAGKCLFEIALDKLGKLKKVDPNDIFVAVGEEELLDIANKYRYPIIIRSYESCHATNTRQPDSLKLLYEWYEHFMRYGNYDYVVLISACNPLLKPETIDEFYDRFKKSEVDGMFSVTEKRNFYWDQYGNTIVDWKGMKLMNTRKVDKIYEGAHCLYGSKISFIKDECWMGDTSPPKPELFVVDDLEATDVDTMLDFEIAEALYTYFNKEEEEDWFLKSLDVISNKHIPKIYKKYKKLLNK